MASFVSALDKPRASSATSSTTATTASDASAARLRECLRFLRHVERVDFHADMARNWDARKCFVLHVTVTDNEAADAANAPAARLQVVRPTAPFQIERTPKELEQLQRAIHEWSAKPHAAAAGACAFCAPIASGEVAVAARRSAGSAGDETSAKRGGGLSSLFRRRATKLKGSEEWEAWLNGSIALLRRVDVETVGVCAGLEHIPALVARFLLQEFASDVIL